MKTRDSVRFAFRALQEKRVRSALVIVMVIMGASLITGLNAMGGGMSVFWVEQFNVLSANVMLVTPSTNAFRIDDRVLRHLRTTPAVAEVIPFIRSEAILESQGDQISAPILGIEQSKLRYIYPKLELASGNFAGEYDTSAILIGNLVAQPADKTRPFAEHGSSVTLKYTFGGETFSRTFRVNGVVSKMGTSGMLFVPVDQMGSISLKAADLLLERGGTYDGAFILAFSQDDVEAVSNAIEQNYGKSLEIFTAKSSVELIQRAIGAFQVFLGAIGAVSLLVAAVGIFVSLYTSVIDRTKEIGVLKALGFTDRMVLGVFMSEAVFLGAIGGIFGVIVGMGIAYVFSAYISSAPIGPEGRGVGGIISPVFPPEMMLSVYFFSIVLSVFAGAYPAWRASRLDPVVSLRKE